MVNFEDLDKEKIAEAERALRDRANTTGKDGSIFNEPFVRTNKIALSDILMHTPSANDGLLPPNYDDLPSEAAVGTRYQEVRLHSYLPSGVDGPNSVQTFIVIVSDPNSHSPTDIEASRLHPLVSPKYSQGKANAAHPDPHFRGFELALYPAKSNGGIGTALIADTSKPISPVADPGAGPPDDMAPGVGTDGTWSVDYEAGVVRFSRAPLNGSNGVMNPNDVFGNISGIETADAYGAITMFATFYHYTGDFGTPENVSFVTVGDGYVSTGIFTGQSHDTVQGAINSLPENGGTVFIKEGTYTFLSSVTIPQNVNIVGLGGSTIRRPTSEAAFIIRDGYVTIEGLEIQPHGSESVVSQGAAIEIGSSQPGEEIKFINIKNNKLYAEDDAYAIGFVSEFNCNLTSIKITGNLFEAEPQSQYAIFIGDRLAGGLVTLTDCSIFNNTFEGGLGSQVIKLSSYVTTIRELKISHNSWDGVLSLPSYDNVSLTSNSFVGGMANIVSRGSGTFYLAANGLLDNNEISYSYDGINWSPVIHPAGSFLFYVAHNNKDLWLLAGLFGYLSRSIDGINWTTPVDVFGGNDIGAIGYNNLDLWVIGGEAGLVSYSYDGIVWSTPINVLTGGDILTVAHNGKDLWIAAGFAGKLTYSYDGINWSIPRDILGGSHIYAVAYNGKDQWQAVGQFGLAAYSSDGINWSTPVDITGGSDLYAIAHNGKDLWVAGAGAGLAFSTNGITWSSFVGVFGTSVRTIAFDGNNLWLAGADDGRIAYSYDGIHWSAPVSILTYVGTIAILRGVNAGVVAHGSPQNGSGIQAFGHGNLAYGVEGFGDGYGAGIRGVGGSLNAPGVVGLGGGSDGYGVIGIGGRSGGIGVLGKGQGQSAGVTGIGGLRGGPGTKSFGNRQLIIATGESEIDLALSSDGAIWSTYSPNFAGNTMADAAHNGKDLWVAVGSNNIYSSEDGITWTFRSDFFTGQPNAVAYNGKNLWVAVGSLGGTGVLATSPDGINWTQRVSIFNMLDIAYGNGLWVAVGLDGNTYYSYDGINWVVKNVPAVTGNTINAIAYSNGLWVIGSSDGNIVTSYDGINWSAGVGAVFGDPVLGLAHNGKDLWVGVGDNSGSGILFTSPDAITWTQQNVGAAYSLVDVVYNGNDLWIAVGGESGTQATIITSPDGVIWTSQNSDIFGTDAIGSITLSYGSNAGVVGHGSLYNGTGVQGFGHGITGVGVEGFGGDGYAVGVKGFSGKLGGAAVQGFGLGELGTGGEFYGSGLAPGAYAKGGLYGAAGVKSVGDGYMMVVVGQAGQLATSTDGVNWAPNASAKTIFVVDVLLDVAHNGKDLWIAAGTSGKLATSTDGLNWIQRTSAADIFVTDSIFGLGYNGKDLWIATGMNGKIATSPDGINWIPRTGGFGTNTINSVSYNGKDLWVAVSDGGKLATSSFGANWTQQISSFANSNINKVIYNGKDLWIAVGQTGKLATSYDGINWLQSASALTAFGANSIIDVAYNGKDLWIAVGGAGKIITSPDGFNWTLQIGTFGVTNIRSIAYNGKDLWVATGESSTISTSPDGVTWISQANGFGGISAIHSVAISSNSNAGVVAHGAQFNGTGIQAFGHGNFGTGIEAFGGDGYGVGIKGVSGLLGGTGVRGLGAGNYAQGGEFYGAGAAAGVISAGTGTMYVAGGGNGKIATSFNGIDWSQRTSSFGADDIYDFAYDGRGTWVAVGEAGKIATSTNGIDWIQRASGLGATNANAVAYNGRGLWVLVSDSGGLYTSPDGTTWTARTSGLTTNIFGLAHNGIDLWVATGSSGKIIISQDATTWTQVGNSFDGANTIIDVASDGKKWIAVSSSSGGALATSPDGYSWTQQYSAATAFGSDGILAIAHNGKDLWAASSDAGKIATSPDGIIWTLQASGFGADLIYSLHHNGRNLWIAGATSGKIATSPDGVTWTQQTSSFGADVIYDIKSVFGSNAGLVAYGSQFNGTGVQAFARGNSGVGVEGFGGDGYGIGIKGYGGDYGGTGIIGYGGGFDGYGVIGIGGAGIGFDPLVFGGSTLTPSGVGVLGIGSTGVIGLGRTMGEGMFAQAGDGYKSGLRAVGGNWGGSGINASTSGTLILAVGTYTVDPSAIYSVDNGLNWNVAPGNFGNANINVSGLDYNDRGLWMAGGGLGKIFTSKDGLTWDELASTPYNSVTEVTIVKYGNGRWVTFALRNVGVNTYDILTYNSTDDGANWTQGAISYTNAEIINAPNAINKVEYNGKDLWIAVAGATVQAPAAGRVFTSKDGNLWTQSPLQATVFSNADVRSIAYGNDVWVAGAENGSIATSTDGVTWILRASIGSLRSVNGIAYNGRDLWVAAAYDLSTFDLYVYTSTDTVTWTIQYTDTAFFAFANTVIYSGDRWIIGGSTGGGAATITTSTDGVTWTTPIIPSLISGINTIVSQRGRNAGIIATGSFNEGSGIQSFGGGKSGTGVEGFGGDGYAIGVYGTSGRLGGAGVRGMGQGPKGYGGEFIGSGWRSGVDATSGLFGAAGITSMAEGQLAIAGGDLGTLAVSSDGYNWEGKTSTLTGSIFTIAHDGKYTWVAAGGNGEIAFSYDDGLTWRLSTNDPFSANINGVAYNGRDLWVAVGNSGVVATSVDGGRSWSGQATIFSGSNANAVAYSKDLWVVVGVSGNLATSSDGVNWTNRTSGFGADNIISIAYDGKDTWMAVGGGGKVGISQDGINWTTTSISGTIVWNDVIHNQKDLWVIVGTTGAIWTSADNGTTWVAQYAGGLENNSIISVAFNGKDLYIATAAAGAIAISRDAVFWNILPDNVAGGTTGFFGSNNVNAIAFKYGANAGLSSYGGVNGSGVQGYGGGNAGVGVEGFGGDGYAVGVRGVSGNYGGAGVRGHGLGGYGFGGEFFGSGIGSGVYSSGGLSGAPGIRAIGNGTLYVGASNGGKIATSYDGITWTPQVSSFGATAINHLAHNGRDQWVAVGTSGTLATSRDGINWTQQPNALVALGTDTILAVAYSGNGLWAITTLAGVIATSRDGITWTTQVSSFSGTSITSIAHNQKDLWVAVGSSTKLATSPDGINWTQRTSNISSTVQDVAFNSKDMWAACGGAGEIATSFDGITWTPQTTGFGASGINAIAHNGKDLWVAAGVTGKVGTSPDGFTWTQQVSGFGATAIDRVAYNGKDLWIISGLSGKVSTSPDGVTWTLQNHAATIFGGDTVQVAVLRGSNAGVVGYGSDDNGSGVQGYGRGNLGAGVEGFGGDGYGVGVRGVGGLAGGTGVLGFGGPLDGYGVLGIGGSGASGGVGIMGMGGGDSGAGVWGQGSGTGAGIVAVGTSSRAALNIVPQVTNPSTLVVGDMFINATDQQLYRVVGSGETATPTATSDSKRLSLMIASNFEGSVSIAANSFSSGCTGLTGASQIDTLGGTNGIMYTTTDDATWTSRTSNFGADTIVRIRFFNNIFFAGGNNAKISTSTNGTTWTARTSNLQAGSYAGAFAYSPTQAIYVVGGSAGAANLSSSTDGSTWTARTSNIGGIINDVLWVPELSLFIAGGGTNGALSTSTNGTAWTARTSNLGAGTEVAHISYHNGIAMICSYLDGTGRIATSTDGTTWTLKVSNLGTGVIGLGYHPVYKRWVAAGNTSIHYSDNNGDSWIACSGTNVANGLFPEFNKDVVYIDDIGFLCRGNNGGGELMHSFDGITWAPRPFPAGNCPVIYRGKYAIIAGGVSSGGSAQPYVSLKSGFTTGVV